MEERWRRRRGPRLGLRGSLSAWLALGLLLLPALGPVSSSSSSSAAAAAVAGSGAAEGAKEEAKECEKPCANGGRCQPRTGQCECPPGWVGEQCQHCGGRFRPSHHHHHLLPDLPRVSSRASWRLLDHEYRRNGEFLMKSGDVH